MRSLALRYGYTPAEIGEMTWHQIKGLMGVTEIDGQEVVWHRQ